MTALTRKSACSFNQRLVELLEEGRGRHPSIRSLEFADRLDALEVEALEHCAPDGTLVMIRVAREAVQFAERIVTRPQAV